MNKKDYFLFGLVILSAILFFVGTVREDVNREKTSKCTPPQSSETSRIKDTGLCAVLVTTNMVSVPCNCGFCRPEDGIRVPEHINRLGYDLELRIETNYLHVIHMANRAYLYNPAKSANEVAQSHLSSLTNGICYSAEAWTNATPECPEPPDLRQLNSKVLTPHD